MNILLCVTGSISAYKTPSIANALVKSGHSVKVILTSSALKFIGKMSFTAQGFDTYIDKDEDNTNNVLHIDLITWSDTVLVAPLSANTLSKVANGITDSLLTSVLRAFPFNSDKKLILAPAMNTDMYTHPITSIHMNTIKQFFPSNSKDNFLIISPVEKKLACGVIGIGALAPINDIILAVEADD